MEEQGRQNGGTAPLTAGSLPANLCRQQNLSGRSDSGHSRFLSCFFGLPVPPDSLFLHCSSLLMFLYCSSRLLFLAWSSANGRDKFLSLMKVTSADMRFKISSGQLIQNALKRWRQVFEPHENHFSRHEVQNFFRPTDSERSKTVETSF
jgi:hypothetical protein